MPRPPFAEFKLWNYRADVEDEDGWLVYDHVVLVNYGTINPVAHKVEADGRWIGDSATVRMVCQRSELWQGWESTRLVRPKLAAQYAVPCLNCWPDSRESRDYIMDVRAGRVDFTNPPQ